MPQKPSVAIWSSVRYSSLRDSRVLRRAFVGGLMGIDIASPNALTYRETGEQVVIEAGHYTTGTLGIGQRTSLVDSAGVTAWQYDARAQVITETRTITGTGSFTTAFGYDAAGRVLTTTYPTGEVITQSYDLAGQLLQVRSSTYVTSYVIGLQYNAFGQPVTATLGNGVVVANTYDPRSGRLLATVSKSGSTPRLDLAYTYDLGGNVMQIVDAVRSETSSFTYDMLDRLLTSQVSESGVGLVRQESYSYSETGNIRSVTRWPETTHLGYGALGSGYISTTTHSRGSVTGLSGGAASLAFVRGGDVSVPLGGAWVSASYYYSNSLHVHAVTDLSSGATFTYDANGNMVTRREGGRVYTQTFDAENRLVSVLQQGVGTTQYIYDGDGQLTMQVNPGGTGRLYLGVVEYELNTNGTTAGSTSYYALPGARAVRTSAGLFYFLTDHLGSASVSLDANGVVVAEMRYDAFGATRLSTGTMPGDRLYTGQQFRIEVGLYYYNARWYSPYLNRFVSADTLVPEPGNPQTLNRYSMVLNNPVKFTDPTGHTECEEVEPGVCIPFDGTPDQHYACITSWGCIDLGHMRYFGYPGGPAAFWKEFLRLASLGGDFSIALGHGTSLGSSLVIEYFVSGNLDPSQYEGVAMAMFQDFASEFESFQFIVSNFANADLPSDYLGLVAAFQGVDPDLLVLGLGGKVEYTDQGTPTETLFETAASNREFTPKVLRNGEYVNIPWPSALQVAPINDTSLWHRQSAELNYLWGVVHQYVVYGPDGRLTNPQCNTCLNHP